MRILNVVGSLTKGGTERAAQNFCEGYFDLGMDSRMFAYNSGGFRRDELETKNIQCWVGENSIPDIKNWEPEVVHYHTNSGIDLNRLLDTFEGAKFVETNVFSKPNEFIGQIFGSYQLSNWCKFMYAARGGNTKKSPVIHYPIKTDNFYKVNQERITAFKKQYDIPINSFLFGRIGQNNMCKWSLALIDLFVRFIRRIEKNAHLVLVNPPAKLIKYCNKQRISENITVIDKLIGDKALRDCYSTIDVFTHIANKGESFGMVLTESLLCETPVITLNTPGRDNSQGEVIGDQKGGIPVNTIDEFYQAMERLFLNSDERKLKGRRGREHILQNYDYLKVCKKSLDYISGNLKVDRHIDTEILKKYSSSEFTLFILKMMYKVRNKYFYLFCDLILRIYYRRF